MTHQQLDDLFRANAERGEFAPADGEWAEMTAMLEADERRERYARLVSGAWAALFLLLIGGGIYGAMHYAPTEELEGWAFPVATEGAAFAKTGGAAVLSLGTDAAVDVQAEVRPEPEVDRQYTAPISPTSIASSEDRRARGASKVVISTKGQANANDVSGARPGGRKTPLAADVTELEGPSLLSPTQLTEVAALTSPPSVGLAPQPNVPPVRQPKWSLSLIAAAEATQVELNSPVAFGYRVGPRLNYRPNARISFSAGLLFGQRGYRAAHDQTTMTSDLFVDDVMPAEMHGQSAVAELPLSVTYYPEIRRGPRWYLNVGLNSYRLFRDEMTFTYDEHREGQLHNMVSPERDEAIAASLRLGGGVALDCFGTLPLEVGPYIHVPLRRTSYSEVSLYSAGVMVGVPLASY